MPEVNISLFDLMVFVGFVQGFVFTFVVLFVQKNREKAVVFLVMMVFFLSLNNLQYWLTTTNATAFLKHYKYLLLPWYFLFGPMFYQFVIHYLKIGDKLPAFNGITFSLFFLGVITRILLLSGCVISEDQLEGSLEQYGIIEESVSFVYALLIFSFATVVHFKNRNWRSYVGEFDDFKWIRTFFLMSAVVLIFWLLAIFQDYVPGYLTPPESYYPVRFGTSFIIYWIGYRGLYKTQLLKDRMEIRENLNPDIAPKKDVNLLDEKKRDIFDAFANYLKAHRKFLDPLLSLEGIAKEMDISVSYLSTAINKHGKSFSEYINTLRVEQAKVLLVSLDYQNHTVVSIGLESGFYSKSAFYAAFKKQTLLSPSEYRKKHLNNLS